MACVGLTAAAIQTKCTELCHRKRGCGFAIFCIIGTVGLFLSAKYIRAEMNTRMLAFSPVIIGMTGTMVITMSKICDLCHTKKKVSGE